VTIDLEKIEAHYRKSQFVKEICVMSLAAPETPARLYAVVVPDMELMRRRQIVNVGDLLRFELEGLSHLLPGHERLAGYEIWFERLPRTTQQEIERDELTRRVRERQHSPPRDAPLSEADRRWLDQPDAAAALPLIQARVKAGVRIWPDANLELDLGLDSMDRVELITELERRSGVRLPQARAAEIYTVRQLVEALAIDKPEGLAAPNAQRSSPEHAQRPWAAILRDLPDLNWLRRKRILAAPLWWLLLRILRILLVRVRISGLDRLPPAGPFIITPNHQSYVDPFVLCGVLPYRIFKDVFFVGAIEYFETPFTRWVAHTANLVPVDPDSNLVPAMRAAAFGLAKGKILMLFPEGERSIDGTVKRFKKGAPILAQHLGVPIVPVALRGIHELWPRNRGIAWALVAPWSGHRVAIEIGAPITVAEAADYDDTAARLRLRVNETWEALSP
jgi:long-chain acyl-CoA synthetase